MNGIDREATAEELRAEIVRVQEICDALSDENVRLCEIIHDGSKNLAKAKALLESERAARALADLDAQAYKRQWEDLRRSVMRAARPANKPDFKTCDHLEAVRGAAKLPCSFVHEDGTFTEHPTRFVTDDNGKVECCTRCAGLRWLGGKVWYATLALLLDSVAD